MGNQPAALRFSGAVFWFSVIAIGAAIAATLGHSVFHASILTFVAAALSLIALSKLLGDATEQLVRHVGQNVAGLINVSLGNLAELIIIFVAMKDGFLDLVQAGIAGSIVGNLLLVHGISIYAYCQKNGDHKPLKPQTVALLIDQLCVVAITLMLPAIFEEHIPVERHLTFSYVLAVMLVGVYLFYYRLSKSDSRFDPIEEDLKELNHRWSLKRSVVVLVAAGIGAFLMSELLVGEVQHIGKSLNVSHAFLGFILLPLLGNIAEHFVAVTAARKGQTDLSLAVSVGSASQVGMIVAPCAVLFGTILGQPFTLNFAGLPLTFMLLSLVPTFVVLHDRSWHKTEGVMLPALYIVFGVAFWFMR